MRTRRGIGALFPTIRKRVLATVVMHPERSWYATELARSLGLSKTSLQRELVNLVHAGVLQRRTRGKQVYYQADSDCPFLPELQGLMAKTAGLGDVVKEALARATHRIAFAFIYGSVARGKELATSDVDLMVVGDVGVGELTLLLKGAREKLGREVNLSVYRPEEFVRKARAGHHFIASVLDRPKLFVVGTADAVERAIGAEAGRASTVEEGRAAGTSPRRKAKPRRRSA